MFIKSFKLGAQLALVFCAVIGGIAVVLSTVAVVFVAALSLFR